MNTLIVVDEVNDLLKDRDWNIISFDTYLEEHPKKNQGKLRVINLCDSTRYLSRGYYCSLLAEARNHIVIPSVKTINELRGTIRILLTPQLCSGKELNWIVSTGCNYPVFIFCGETTEPALDKLSRVIFKQYPSPLLKLEIDKDTLVVTVERLSLKDLSYDLQKSFIEKLTNYHFPLWKRKLNSKKYRWELAILVNNQEVMPPSDRKAVEYFVKAASKFGIKADIIEAKDLLNLRQYDALFIRETTAIDHYTYQMSCEAEKLGLIVIDDSTSILRCCNKVFLHDAFSYNDVPTLKTLIVNRFNDLYVEEIEQEFDYPFVLKKPESSFSQGVYKVENRKQLTQRLETVFEQSALALVQEYMYTEYDWRIGVLNGRAIYACRYYMARNHWQIYNHGRAKSQSGAFDSLPTFEVPKYVLKASLNACKLIGNGLYGVDIKVKNNHAYVIEVNDNPSIDSGVEDKYLGQELYMLVMSEFFNRLEGRGK